MTVDPAALERLTALADQCANLKQGFMEAWTASYGSGGRVLLEEDLRSLLSELHSLRGGEEKEGVHTVGVETPAIGAQSAPNWSMQNETTDKQDYRRDILNGGGATLWALSNVAPGSFGYVVRSMERAGLLVSRYEPGSLPSEDRWYYTLTDAGEEAKAALS